MSTTGPILCLACSRLNRSTSEIVACTAFPEAIPAEILDGADHREARGDEIDGLAFDKADTPAADVALDAWLAIFGEDLTDDDAPGPDEVGDEDADFDEDELAHIHALLDDEDDDYPEAQRADLAPGRERLHHYWTRGKGLAKWLGHPHPWTSLYRHLRKYVGSERAKRMAAKWVHEVTGNWPGSDRHRVATGHKPRGKYVGDDRLFAKRSDDVERRRPYPGQRYKHGWIPVAGTDTVDGVREVLSNGQRVGSPSQAERLAQAMNDGVSSPEDLDFEHVGSGSQREVWLDPFDTVYKIGDDSANREEARVLSKLRAEGAEYAPDVTLYEVDVEDAGPFGSGPIEKRTVTVVAMPYLPEDESVPHAGVVLPGAGDLNPANVVSNGGKLWLIDAGGM